MKKVDKVKEATKITIVIHWFSFLAEKRGVRKETVQVPLNSTGEDLMREIASNFPTLYKYREHIRLAVNQEYVTTEVKLKERDEVAFITPVSGG